MTVLVGTCAPDDSCSDWGEEESFSAQCYYLAPQSFKHMLACSVSQFNFLLKTIRYKRYFKKSVILCTSIFRFFTQDLTLTPEFG